MKAKIKIEYFMDDEQIREFMSDLGNKGEYTKADVDYEIQHALPGVFGIFSMGYKSWDIEEDEQ